MHHVVGAARAEGGGRVGAEPTLEWKLMSLSLGQEFGELQEQACLLTQLLTMTATHKFPPQVTFQRVTIPNHYLWLYKNKQIMYMVK